MKQAIRNKETLAVNNRPNKHEICMYDEMNKETMTIFLGWMIIDGNKQKYTTWSSRSVSTKRISRTIAWTRNCWH